MRKLVRDHPIKFWLGAWILAGLIGMASGAITKVALAQTSACQTSTTGVVGGVNCLRLNGRFFSAGPGSGVEGEALLGFRVTDVSEASGTLTVDFIDSSGATDSLDYTGAEDGVLASATWSTANQTLTLTLADGTTIPVALSGLETQAEVTAAINAAIANRLVRSDIIAGNNITISNGAGNSLEISSSGGGGGGGSNDGVATLVELTTSGSDLTLRLERSVGIDLSDTVTLSIADGAVGTDQLADDAVTQAKLANNSVHAAQIGANAVGTSEISANAVGTSELSADAVTNANLADDSVHNDQLASNSVRADEIQANAVGHVEMNDDSVGVDELITTNTPAASQVLGYNGAAMTWVAQTGGGGGGGTDDQTAAEVPVTATGFSGNLSGTDTDVQTALDTIDGFTLGGGGGGSSTWVGLTETPSAITANECVQGNAAGNALVFAACATGGGAATSEQRVESVTFADVDNITSTATTLTLAATTPIAVEFGDGGGRDADRDGRRNDVHHRGLPASTCSSSPRSTRRTATAPRPTSRFSRTATMR